MSETSLVLILAFVLVSAPSIRAHAVLIDAQPAAKSAVAGPDVGVRLRFNSRIDSARSMLWLVLPDHSIRTLAIAQQQAPQTIVARARQLISGDYQIRWQVLASDGHITRGEFAFKVN